MLVYIIGVDEAMVEAALHASNPAAVFFDLKAAFLSVLHSFLLGVLKHIGLPAPILNFIVCLQDSYSMISETTKSSLCVVHKLGKFGNIFH